MPNEKISQDQKRNFIDIKESISSSEEALMFAYDTSRNEKVLLIGTIFEGDNGNPTFAPHAEVLDLSEKETDSRYVLQTEEQFQKLTS